MKKILLVAAVGAVALLAGCSDDDDTTSCTVEMAPNILACAESSDGNEISEKKCRANDGIFGSGCASGYDLKCPLDGGVMYTYGTAGYGLTCSDID